MVFAFDNIIPTINSVNFSTPINMNKETTTEVKDIINMLCLLQKKYIKGEIHDSDVVNQLKELKVHFLKSLPKTNCSDSKFFTQLFILICEKFKKTVYEEKDFMYNVDIICEKFNEMIKAEIGAISGANNIHAADKNRAYNLKNHKYESKTKRSNFPKHILRILKSWLKNHIESPYPTEMEKIALSEATGLDQTQINNWFINARRRLLPDLKNKK